MTRQTPETMMKSALRFERGLALLSDPAYTFEKVSETETGFYVKKSDGTVYMTLVSAAVCSCEDFNRNNQPCKHFYAAQELLNQEAQCEGYDPNVESGRDEYPL